MSSLRLGLSVASVSVVSALVVWGCAEDEGGAARQCVPGIELCNGLDDDCDGYVDEDDQNMQLTKDCSNGCGEGFQVCENGAYNECDAPQPQTEVCNGKDDDCDGFADNGFDCAVGDTRACGSDVGECKKGTEECAAGCHWSSNCVGDVEPQDEKCEGSKDEDCDGTVDNDCGCTAGETKECCGGQVLQCQNGKWPSCPAPPAETCNHLDDDCSGVVDDHLPADPYLKDEGTTDSCEHAYTQAFTTPLAENGPKKSYQFFLYHADGSIDRDYFSFPTTEQSDAECISNPNFYECYMLSVRISAEPAGKDYELCVYDMGGSAAGASCAGKPKSCSKADGNGPNEVIYMYEGGCGNDDDNRFVVEVFGATDSDQSCEPYEIEMELLGDGPQPTDCGL